MKIQKDEVRYRMVSGFAQFLVILAGGLVVILTIGFFAFKNGQIKLNSSTSKSALSPTPTGIDETANWKTYTNETYKYSFKYPSDFEIQELPPAGLEPMFAVVLRDNNNNQIFSIKTDKDYLPGDVLYYLDTASSGVIEINGIKWSEYKLPQGSQDSGSKTEPTYALQTENNNILYSISIATQQSLDKTQNQILSTFQFTN